MAARVCYGNFTGKSQAKLQLGPPTVAAGLGEVVRAAGVVVLAETVGTAAPISRIKLNNFSQPTPLSTPTFVKVSPEDLANIAREHTAAQGEYLLESYIGKWMKISDVVSDVHSGTENPLRHDDPSVVFRRPNLFTVIMRFDKSSRDRVVSLSQGDHITVAGRIKSINRLGLDLSDCTFTIDVPIRENRRT